MHEPEDTQTVTKCQASSWKSVLLTFIEKDGTGPKVIVSLDNGLLDAIYESIKWLAHKAQWSDNVEHILQITSRAWVCVSTTDRHILLSVKVTIPTQMPNKKHPKKANWSTSYKITNFKGWPNHSKTSSQDCSKNPIFFPTRKTKAHRLPFVKLHPKSP